MEEFVIEMIVNVSMLTRLDKDVNKISFLNINASNFLLNEKCQYFLLEENISNLF